MAGGSGATGDLGSQAAPPPPAEQALPQLRRLPDDTLLVVLSDTHIGGDGGQAIFESPQELAALFAELAAHAGAVELVLGGDFFDFLRISSVPSGTNRAALTLERPEYQALFEAMRRFVAHEQHHVVYLPGNHDAETWWNHDIQATLRQAGLVHEFAPSYAAYFASAPAQIVYCEHGNQFDPANTFCDYNDPLETPLGDHVVTDVLRLVVPQGHLTSFLNLRELNHVFPIAMIPEWIGGRLFYELLHSAIIYLIIPIVIAYLLFRGLVIAVARLQPEFAVLQQLFIGIAYDALLLVVAFGVFFVAVRRMIRRLAASLGASLPSQPRSTTQDIPQPIATLLASDHTPPMARSLHGQDIALFISGHTHAPALHTRTRTSGAAALVVNSGCWLRQLQPIAAHLHGPPVFVTAHVLTHVRVFCSAGGLRAELWAQPKPAAQDLPWLERLAIFGRRPPQPPADAPPVLVGSGELPLL